ncbi:glycosyltransferase family 4 protein [Microbacterium sp. HA-8]|uniref:glycosyltransferase family 4 protein n=1 Tax=Microbacterium sp. HA-8 TaxID=3234200 RepID=UPI0038F7D7EA
MFSHNDALVGQVYVNHGVLREALRMRPDTSWRWNPLHRFLLAREWLRHRSRGYRRIVCISKSEEEVLARHYPRTQAMTTVISNGVDTTRFTVPSEAERRDARSAIGVGDQDPLALFVGHEFDRKGLFVVLAALDELQDLRLHVVGGSPAAIDRARTQTRDRGLSGRVSFAGVGDPRSAYVAADVLVVPSRYEAAPLVLIEALSTGVPFVSGTSGIGADLIAQGAPGVACDIEYESVARAVRAMISRRSEEGRPLSQERCRAVASRYDWTPIARQYVDLARDVMRR